MTGSGGTGEEDRGRLVPFGRQEPKMCISVTVRTGWGDCGVAQGPHVGGWAVASPQVLVPEFTLKDSVTKVIEGRIYKAVEVLLRPMLKQAAATVAATANAKQHAMVQAFAEATDQVTASYQARFLYVAEEAQATSVEKATASATRRANATRPRGAAGDEAA
eukprot:Skav228824  [mRNA]  locus=scaffold359:526675:532821:+ [translate_table: standard]